jgi:hypothetical protein
MNKLYPKSSHTLEDKNSSQNDFIPGIFNYCDRWCERCKFNNKCEVYSMEKEDGLADSEGEDMKSTLERVSNIFALTMEMLHEMASDIGLDLNNLEETVVTKHIPGKIEELANEYGKDVYAWLKKNRQFFNQQVEQYYAINENTSKKIKEVIEVLSWYAPLIGAKVHRAMYKTYYEDETDFHDKRGSAKIALISIERSIGAFSYILNNFPEKEDESLNYLAKLSRIKRLLYKDYPNAMDFKRPGFDD